MNIVMTTVLTEDAERLDAHVAFHLNAGVDFVLVSALGPTDEIETILEPYERAGYLRRMPSPGAGASGLTDMARVAVAEHAADWIIPSTASEFWWPRGESLKDVLAVIPPRYAVVQALVRSFAAQREGFFADAIHRSSLLSGGPDDDVPRRLLRPIYRADESLGIDPDDWTLGGRRVPLRAWYPIEVLHFPASASVAEGAKLNDRVPTGEFVVDTRLRDALRQLRAEGDGRFALPTDGTPRLVLPAPNVVDDASYAIECAAVGEVDLVRLDAQIRELELRIAALEARLWPRFRRALRRLARRPS